MGLHIKSFKRGQDIMNRFFVRLAIIPFLGIITVFLGNTSAAAEIPKVDCSKIKTLSPFYHNNSMQAVRVEQELRQKGDIESADTLEYISCVPQGTWFVGGDKSAVKSRASGIVRDAAAEGKIPVLVLYNAPAGNRNAWLSGVGDAGAYKEWVRAIAEGVGSNEAWVMLEPDAIALAGNLSGQDQNERFGQISDAISILKTYAPHVRVYIDGGHSSWKSEQAQADFLLRAGIEKADGFFTNVSHFRSTADEITYGKSVSGLVGGKHFVIDTSRNGKGSLNYEWCNPSGRAIGVRPTLNTGDPFVDAYLWIKLPGESDGTCNGGPSAGKFWLEYALGLVHEALTLSLFEEPLTMGTESSQAAPETVQEDNTAPTPITESTPIREQSFGTNESETHSLYKNESFFKRRTSYISVTEQLRSRFRSGT